MADTKLTALSAFTPILTDILYGADDPGGTPVSGKHTYAVLRTLLEANLVTPIIAAAANTEALAVTGYSLTGSDATSMIDLAGTWNTTGTPSAVKLDITDTASNAASLLMDLQVGGSSMFKVNKAGEVFALNYAGTPLIKTVAGGVYYTDGANSLIGLNSGELLLGATKLLSWASGAVDATTADLTLVRDAADTLAQRRTTNAQTFNIYGTDDGAGNNRYITIFDSGGDLFLRTVVNGTGGNPTLNIGTTTANSLRFETSGAIRWQVASVGHFYAQTDDTYDIGATGATRPRDIYLAGTLNLQNATANKAALVGTGYSLTGSDATSMVDLAGTWNTTGTPTALKLDVTDTASNAASLLMDLQVGAASKFNVDKAGSITLGADLTLHRTAANTLALRRTTNAQTLNIYNTWTDASNYERGFMRFVANSLDIGSEATGTGTVRDVRFLRGATPYLNLTASAFNVPVNATFSGSIQMAAADPFSWAGRAKMYSPADSIIRLADNAGTAFDRLQFGGTTSSFPALKRSSALLQARLADDSGHAAFEASRFTTPDAGELTIATGAITVTGGFHTVDTEADAASDDLDTINGGVDGAILMLQAEVTTRTVNVTRAGNIHTSADPVALADTESTITLMFSGALSAWVEIGNSTNV